MIISRTLSIFFRFAQFVCSAVVLGIAAYFVNRWRRFGDADTSPHGRLIYTLVIAAISTLFSLLWLLPFTYTFLHYPFDFLMSAAWFAAFGLLVNWSGRAGCGRAFAWAGLYRGGEGDRWKAAEAFSFLAACFWLASALLGMWVYHRLRRREPVAVDTTTTRRSRWGRRHRSAV